MNEHSSLGGDAPTLGWRQVVGRLSRLVDHEDVYRAVCEAGGTSGGYLMMSVLSSAIATLGLLLSSPAVVIGAMLISPLMGPIILLGFAFWRVDPRSTRRAIESLAVGLGGALAVALVLTWLSPLKEPTTEILARTRPNLFDLAVAAFSGIAGGYAVIRQRGETVIGVAIATALMPPIATVGFGIGVGNWAIALGALLLFATNLTAIALAAGLMAALYGFRPHLARRGLFGQAIVILIVVALCVPLSLSLNTIALESRASASARGAIQAIFGPKARLTSLSATSGKDGLEVTALVATPKYVASASSTVEQRLRRVTNAPAKVVLDQVVLANPERFVSEEKTAPAAPDPIALAAQALKDAVPFATTALAYDPDAHRGVVLLAADSGLGLGPAMKLEQGLRARPGLEGTLVVPPVQPLVPVPITFANGRAPAFGAALAADSWALARWQARPVATFCGLGRRGARLAAAEKALGAAMGSQSVAIETGGWRACHGAGMTGPFLLLSRH
ncbi:MAG TPA: DUF389 domain-containing protein [Caulobacteraceae bacterium]|nr:DUF389 domain-containing protein [Caulobacteraceae bacterium]